MVIRRKEYEALVQEKTSLSVRNDILSGKVEKLEAELKDAERQIVDLCKQLDSLTEEKQKTSKELADLKRKAEEEEKAAKQFAEEAKGAFNQLSDFGSKIKFDPYCGMGKEDKEAQAK